MVVISSVGGRGAVRRRQGALLQRVAADTECRGRARSEVIQ